MALGVTVDWLVSGYDRIEEMGDNRQRSGPVAKTIEKWAAATTEIMREDGQGKLRRYTAKWKSWR